MKKYKISIFIVCLFIPIFLFSQSKKNKFVQGLGKVDESVKILLDVNKLLKDEELAAISAVEE